MKKYLPLVAVALVPSVAHADVFNDILDYLAGPNWSAISATLIVVWDLARRFIKTDKPASFLQDASSILNKSADVLKAVAGALDSIFGNRTK